jgi:hypothetical protein
MRRKKKLTPFPRAEATALTSTTALDAIKAMDDDQLLASLLFAGEVEAWANTMIGGLKETDALMAPVVAAAMHTRIAREVMASIYTLRHPPAGEDGKPKVGDL